MLLFSKTHLRLYVVMKTYKPHKSVFYTIRYIFSEAGVNRLERLGIISSASEGGEDDPSFRVTEVHRQEISSTLS